LSATLIVDPPQQITKQVTVQLVQTALDSGTSPATVFGNATQRADIEAGIDAIWAQAGIDIKILPTITRYNNTFAYQGTAGTGTRPTGDLNTIFNNARTAGVLSSDSLTLNLMMVNVAPGFMPLDESTSAGLSFVGGNGMAGYVGDSLLTFDDGRNVIAGVMAHEIGHNLDLGHTASGIANLMSPMGTSQQLTTTQITMARSSNFARLYTPPPLVGDYNRNGAIDGAEYIVWRNTLNQTGSGLPADGNNNGVIDTGDYTTWRTHFAATGVGSGSEATLVPKLQSVGCLLAVFSMLVANRWQSNTGGWGRAKRAAS
jgi:hypothetical protein